MKRNKISENKIKVSMVIELNPHVAFVELTPKSLYSLCTGLNNKQD